MVLRRGPMVRGAEERRCKKSPFPDFAIIASAMIRSPGRVRPSLPEPTVSCVFSPPFEVAVTRVAFRAFVGI
jgi:hypothetical protein